MSPGGASRLSGLDGPARPGRMGRRPSGRFQDRVTEVLLGLAPGEVVSYGDVAVQAGFPGAARAVGGLLAGSDGLLPWWRVVTSTGRLVPGFEREHARRLREEGVEVIDGRVARPGRRTRSAAATKGRGGKPAERAPASASGRAPVEPSSGSDRDRVEPPSASGRAPVEPTSASPSGRAPVERATPRRARRPRSSPGGSSNPIR